MGNIEVKDQDQLRRLFEEQRDQDPDWQWEVGEHLCLLLDGETFPFSLKAHVHHHVLDLELLAREKNPPALLLVPQLTERLKEKCRQLGLSVLDLNGHAWIRGKGLLIERPPLKGRAYRNHQSPGNIFDGKSERIVRSLLTNRDRAWTQSELIQQTGVSQGLVSRVCNHLVKEGYVLKTEGRRYQVSPTLDLLDAWVAADRLQDRVTVCRISGLDPDPWSWAERLDAWAAEKDIQLAYTQWLAAWDRHAYTEPVICSAYVSAFPSAEELSAWGARQVSDAGVLWLYRPKDEGIFLEAQRVQNRPVVPDAQIYLDLQKSGLRGPDAADELRKWEGFCRP